MYSKLVAAFFVSVCCGCSVWQDIPSVSQNEEQDMPIVSQEEQDTPPEGQGENTSNASDKLSEKARKKMVRQFQQEIKRLQEERKTQPEFRVLIVNWAAIDNESLDVFEIVRGLSNGGEIWLNGHAADAIDAEWRQLGNADYEGKFNILPALVNWIGTFGWRLIEVHDSNNSGVNFPNKLYFIKKKTNSVSTTCDKQGGK